MVFCVCVIAFIHLITTLTLVVTGEISQSQLCNRDLRADSSGPVTARLWPGYGPVTARLRPGYGSATARLRPGYGPATAR